VTQTGVPQLLGPYELHAELGRGGMGIVYRATDKRLGRMVALKVVQPVVAVAAGISMNDLKAKLRQEAQLAARVMHPNVVTVFAFEELGENAVIAMELVEGPTLHDVLVSGARWTIEQAARLIEQAADGVAAAHALGIVHRDIKPGNLMLATDGRVKVLDFGIAKATSVDASAAVSRVTFGTVQYMAPEQVLGRPVSPATDVWALGVILYEVVTGTSAFGDGAAVTIGMRVAGEEPAMLLDDRTGSQVFGPLFPVLKGALVKQPAGRIPTAGHLRDAVRAIVGGPVSGPVAVSAPLVAPPPAPPPAPKPVPAPKPARARKQAPGVQPQPAAVPAPVPPPPAPPSSPVPTGDQQAPISVPRTGPRMASRRVRLIAGALAATLTLLVVLGILSALPGGSSGAGGGGTAVAADGSQDGGQPSDTSTPGNAGLENGGTFAAPPPAAESSPPPPRADALPSGSTAETRPPTTPVTTGVAAGAASASNAAVTAPLPPPPPQPNDINVNGLDGYLTNGGYVNVTRGQFKDLRADAIDAAGVRLTDAKWRPQHTIEDGRIASATANSAGNVRVNGLKEGQTKLTFEAIRDDGTRVTKEVTVQVLEPVASATPAPTPAPVRVAPPSQPSAPAVRLPTGPEIKFAWERTQDARSLRESKLPGWASGLRVPFPTIQKIVFDNVLLGQNGDFGARLTFEYKGGAINGWTRAAYAVTGKARVNGERVELESLQYNLTR
jgi:eukaryotic-like serine/threonine-protein kinase